MEKSDRKKLLKELREGAPDRDDPIGYLAGVAGSRDAALAKAACAGLFRYDDTRALCGLAGRLLDPHGVDVIRYNIEIIVRAAERGSIVILAATLFLDGRFIVEKFKALEAALESTGDMISLSYLAALRRNEEIFSSPRRSLKLFDTVRSVPNRDMTAGVLFGSAYRGVWGEYQDALPRPGREEYLRAVEYIHTRVPGLVEVFEGRLDARGGE